MRGGSEAGCRRTTYKTAIVTPEAGHLTADRETALVFMRPAVVQTSSILVAGVSVALTPKAVTTNGEASFQRPLASHGSAVSDRSGRHLFGHYRSG